MLGIAHTVRSNWIEALLIAAPLVACLGTMTLFWPGFTGYDAVLQYHQAVSGDFSDWHPPVMARLWSVLPGLTTGAGAMLVIQVLAYWMGIGLLANALQRSGHGIAGFSIIVVGASPLFLGWQGEVVKDSQMLSAMTAAVGLIAWWKLADRSVPATVWFLFATVVLYATLVRANAVFATVPLVVMTCISRGIVARAIIGCALTAATVVLAPIINHSVLSARDSGMGAAPLVFDLAGIYSWGGKGDGMTAAERNAIDSGRCYKPMFWDPLFQPTKCGNELARLWHEPLSSLAITWLRAIAEDPIAYANHRVAHWNRTMRFVVGPGLHAAPSSRSYMPPRASEADPWKPALPEPGRMAIRFEREADRLSELPLTWPVAWFVVAVTCLGILAPLPHDPVRNLALALLVSAMGLDVSFTLVSVASQFRYHLWPMFATAMALVMVMSVSRRSNAKLRNWIVGGALALALVVTIGAAARLSLPLEPQRYTAMLER